MKVSNGIVPVEENGWKISENSTIFSGDDMLTLALRDRKSIAMSVTLNSCWFLIYASIFAFNMKAIGSLIIYGIGVLFTYFILHKWNKSTDDLKLSKPELRILVRPDTREELSLANQYRIPFFFILWIPVSVAFIFLRYEMVDDGKILHLAASLALSQLILFDFINLEIRSGLIGATKE